MQSYLFIGGTHDGINCPVADDAESIELPRSAASQETYIRSTLSAGDSSVTFYRHEDLATEQVLDRLLKYYVAWTVNRLGGRK